MGHQALHFSKAIQRSVGWPFCVERREGRGVDEKAPSVMSEKVCKILLVLSPMLGVPQA